jgi:ubiquinone/menaquinone biosynthesis C-methylase UbiE
MNENLIQKIRHDFDRIALYDRQEWNHNNHYHSFLLKQLPTKGNTVLDIGCGTGEFSRLLAQRFDIVVAIDLSPKMIEVAKQRSQHYRNIDFQVADILQWRFPLEQFEAIASIATFHHLAVKNLLPNLKAALKPGGKLVILDLLEHENVGDFWSDLIAVPLNWLFLLKNRPIQPSPAAIEAMREHLRSDKFLTRSQVKQIYPNLLPKAKIRKHLFWRYSVVWQKPLLT